MSKNLVNKFNLFCKTKNFENNLNQIQLIKTLQQFYNDNFKFSIKKFFTKDNSKKAFYLYGEVGVGKTMILNFFFNLINKNKQRLHFNEFMLEFHDFVHKNKSSNNENVIVFFVKKLKSKVSLIYFDEFQVTNIVDAMILGKLFEQIFKENIRIILTSNTKISDLYKDGLQRDQFIPFIKIMKKNCIEHELIIEDDYRKSQENKKQRLFFPLNKETYFKMNKLFRIITKNKKKILKTLNIKGRKLEIENYYEGVSRFNFNELCSRNLGAEDYLEIAKLIKFMVIDEIPQFDNANSNQQHRFITLIDVIYEKNIPLAVSANQNLDQFKSSLSLEKPFKRTISRLYELTSKEYNL